jgi:hypothetical protein
MTEWNPSKRYRVKALEIIVRDHLLYKHDHLPSEIITAIRELQEYYGSLKSVSDKVGIAEDWLNYYIQYKKGGKKNGSN